MSRSPASSRAWAGTAPPLPPTYRFQPFSVAMTPKSLLRASAHSRAQPLTPPLSLCGAAEPAVAQLERDREADAVLHAEAAPGRADARLHRAQRLAVGVAGLEAGVDEPPPDRGQLLHPGAEEVDPLAAGDLGVEVEVAGDLADHDELVGGDLAAGDARDDRVGAVALDVGEVGVVGVLQLAGVGVEHVAVELAGQDAGDRRLADVAAAAGAVRLDDVVEAAVAVHRDHVEELLAGEPEVLAQALVDDLADRARSAPR